MVRRHPHVFGDAIAADSAAVLRQWERIKQEEARCLRLTPTAPPPPCGGTGSPAIPSGRHSCPIACPRPGGKNPSPGRPGRFPMAGRGRRHRKSAGGGPEEVARAREANDQARLHEEWGDLLFALVNVARYLDIDSETALRDATNKFRDRFQYVERQAHASGRSLDDMTWRKWTPYGTRRKENLPRRPRTVPMQRLASIETGSTEAGSNRKGCALPQGRALWKGLRRQRFTPPTGSPASTPAPGCGPPSRTTAAAAGRRPCASGCGWPASSGTGWAPR